MFTTGTESLEPSGLPPYPSGGGILLPAAWFGLLAGGLELATVLGQEEFAPRASQDALRTNVHRLWMIPVADAVSFGIVGLALASVVAVWPGAARSIAWRLLVGLLFLTPLLAIEGLNPLASLILACGLALNAVPWLEARSAHLGGLIRWSFPALAVGLTALIGISYSRVVTAEARALAQSPPPTQPGAPNVLLVVLDTVRASCLSLYGHERPTTPTLERLAKRGAVFTEARAPAPWTAPTHASLMTGRWPHELSVAPGVPLDATHPTLAEVLGGQGYATAGFVGNIYYCNALYGFARGFARYEDAYENRSVTPIEVVWSTGLGRRLIAGLGFPTTLDDGTTLARKSAEMINRDVFRWLSGAPQDRPFFVFINYYDAHRPYVLPDGPHPRFGKCSLPIAEQLVIDRRFQELTAQGPDPQDPAHRQIHADSLELCHDSYDTAIAYLDRQVGLLLDGIEARGRLDNTLVIITSDHGEELGERGMVTHGASLYRPEVHVPLLILPPSRSSMPTAPVVDAPVSLRDIPATIAQWAIPGRRNPFPGQSLTGHVSDDAKKPPTERPVLSELQHNIAFPNESKIPAPFGAARSVVANGRVYIRRDDGEEELYDLKTDPFEANNLAELPECRAEVQDFREQLERLR